MSRLKANGFAGLSRQQLQTLQRGAPTADDILNNRGFAREVNEEIAATYDQEEAYAYGAKHDPDFDRMIGDLASDDDQEEGDDAEDFPADEEEEETDMSDEFDPDYDPVAAVEAEMQKLVEEAERLRRAREAAQENEARRKAAKKGKAEPESAEEAEAEQELDPEQMRLAQIMNMLKQIPGAPNEKQIKQLKAKYGGSLNVVALGENDVYLFTHLRRATFQQIQEATRQEMQSGAFNRSAEDAMKERVIQSCVIFPRLTLEFFKTSRAGVVDTLYELIMLHSYFLSPQQAMYLTAAL